MERDWKGVRDARDCEIMYIYVNVCMHGRVGGCGDEGGIVRYAMHC